ncbi:MAG: ABC transporter permease [Clostridiales bacterium]|nr:ABC transporter permease [Clostridiales bacterium]
MLTFILQKIVKKKWMMLALLVGNILLIGITVSNPVYTRAVLQRMLLRNLSDYMVSTNAYPGLATIKVSAVADKVDTVLDGERKAREIPALLGVPAIDEVTHYALNAAKVEPEIVRDDDRENKAITLGALSDLSDHAKLTAGRMYADQPADDGAIEVVVSERGLVEMNLLMGETIAFPTLTDKAGSVIRIRIVGVFTNSLGDDPYWVRTPRSYYGEVLMSLPLFRDLFIDQANQRYPLSGLFYELLDYTQMRGDRVGEMRAAVAALSDEYASAYNRGYSDNFSAIFARYALEAKKVDVTMWVLQAPIFVLLAAFIFMVSRQMLETEQNEIAVIKSRGASRRQIITTYLLQSLLLAAAGLAGGVPLGMFLCQVLGASNAFLEFVQRTALTLELTPQALLFALAAALLSVAAMVLPVFRYSSVTIVAHKQKKGRRGETPFWQKTYLDVVLLGVSLYGLYTFNGQKDVLAQRVAEGASLDPLMFFSSSLFILGAGLVALRLMPLIVWAVYGLGKRWWSPSLYASFLRVLRARSNQGFIMVFLVLTIALGIFNAQAARTINTTKEENIRYNIGADVVAQELWTNNSALLADNPEMELMWDEPDFGKYGRLVGNGVASVTAVLNGRDATMSVGGGTLKNVQVMGINTREFGQTAWFKPSLLSHHWYEYLNVMAKDARAVLVSRNFKTNYDLDVGDAIYYRNGAGDSARGVIYGFVDYWPGYAPYQVTRDTDGQYRQNEQYLVVAHLKQLQAYWGMTPYQVWMKMEGSSQPVYDFAEEQGIRFETFLDARQQIVTLKNDPVFQGTNGVLTVGFIVVLILCSTGFLIYWILSIQSRALQFGIFRAMGLSMREIVTMLINEQVFISGLSIAVGALVGNLASRLYVPLIQLAYSASDQSVPLAVVSAQSDAARLFAVIGAMMLICMAILGALISRMKIAQALKLGED